MKVWRQTDSTSRLLRAHGCGAYAAIAAYGWASDGAVGPSGIVSATNAAEARVEASGVSDRDFARRGLSSRELERSLAAIRRRDDRPALDSQRRSGVKVREVLLPQMTAEDAGALVAVDYGVVIDGGRGASRTFRGGHWVFAFEPSGDSISIADPLRTQVISWPISLLVRAAERFGSKPWGDGRAEAIVVWKWPTYRDLMYRARAQRDDLKVELADATKSRLSAERSLVICADSLKACREQGGCTPEALAAEYQRGMHDEAAHWAPIEGAVYQRHEAPVLR